MQIPPDQILELIRSRGDGDRAGRAEPELPDQVDTGNAEHEGLLDSFGIDPSLMGSIGKQPGPPTGSAAHPWDPPRSGQRLGTGSRAGHIDERSPMSERNTLVRSLHDVGLAAWFGGSLAGAVAVNGAAADVPDPRLRLRVASTGWGRWAPVSAVAIGAHLIGGAGLLRANRGRAVAQGGVGAMTVAKLVLTGAALAVTAYSGVLGRKLAQADSAADGVAVGGATDPAATTPPDVAGVQRQLDTCQWLIPTLTGGISVLTAVAGEQQRPGQQISGLLRKPGQWLSAAA